MRVMTIDPGFKRLGYGIFDEEENLLDRGVYFARERGTNESYQSYLNTGIEQIYHWFLEKALTYEITTIKAEIVPAISSGKGFNNSPQIPLVISAITVCKVVAYQLGITWSDISARRVKKLLTGDSKATKAKVRNVVLDIYPEIKQGRLMKEIYFDETDAIAIGIVFFDQKDDIEDGN